MLSNQKLFSVGNFDFRLQHLLIIGILSLAFSISILLRSTPMSYGDELFEYDTFFNFRATEYLVNNSVEDYFQWHDEKSWHPFGRNVSDTSQVTLHLTTAILYQIFNFGMSLYDFTILFPLVIGSLTAVAVFGFVRVLGGTTAGLFASLMFAVSIPIVIRGFAGWFKSEPLGLFFGFLALYLFVSGIKYNKGKISFLKLIGGAIFLALALSAWGGMLFFVLAIILFIFALPFIKNDKNFLIWSIPVFSITFILASLLFERTSAVIFGYLGIAIILPTGFVVISEIIKKFSSETTKIRNCFFFLVSIIISGVGIFITGLINLPSFRYQNAINPLLITQDALTDSVSEHAVTNLTVSFGLLSIFIIFGMIGIWLLFSKKAIHLKTDMRFFSLLISLGAIYLSSAFVRLELFASIGLFILGGIGLSLLLKEILQSEKSLTKYVFSIAIISLFIFPLILPENNNWTVWTDFSPTILNGGTPYNSLVSYDFIDAMTWIKQNTPEDSVIASWWDYGYWITTLSDRTTLIDNATLIDWQIQKVAFSFLTSPENSWNILNSDYNTNVSESFSADFLQYLGDPKPNPVDGSNPVVNGMDADYIVIFATVTQIAIPDSDLVLYSFEAGGDESKKHWFAKISNQNPFTVMESDGVTPTLHFMKNTALGNLIPFSIVTYVDPRTDMTHNAYSHGFIPIFVKDIKFDNPDTDPFFLVYASPSFYTEIPDQKLMVFVYKINSNYN